MSYQEKRSLSNIIMSLIITVVYFMIVYSKYQNGDFDASNEMVLWSKIVLVFIPISIAARIVLMIIFRIFGEIRDEIKGEKEDRDITDERDKLIALKGNRNSAIIFAFGFILALITQVIGGSISTFFIVMIIGGFFSEVIENLSQIFYYRRGV